MITVDYTLTAEERETHISITKNSDGQEIAELETTENKIFNRLVRQGWTLTNEIRNMNGGLIQANFEAPANMITFRDVNKARKH